MESWGQAETAVASSGGQGFFLLVNREGRVVDADGPFGARGGLLGRPFDEGLRHAPELVACIRTTLAGTPCRSIVWLGGRAFEVRAQPRLSDDGHLFGAFVVGTVSVSATELRLLFEQVPGAIWTTDRRLVLTSAFGRILHSREVRQRAVVGNSVEQVLGTSDPKHPSLAHHHAALEGRSGGFELELSGRWYRVRVEPLRASDGEVIGVVGAAFDVTDQRRLHEKLAQREARLSEAQQLAHVGSFTWDLRSLEVSWSDELYAIYGLSPEEFRPTWEDFLDRVYPEDRAITHAKTLEAIERRTAVEYEHRIERPDGALRTLRTRAAPALGPNGKPVRLVGSCWDVTEQVRAERALERTVSTLRATLDATADGILVVDRGGRLATFNARFLSLWQIPQHLAESGDDEALLAFVEEQLEQPEAFRAKVAELYATPDAESFDVLRFRDGRVFERNSRPQRLDGRPIGRVWSFRDVTERERLLHRALFLADAGRLLASLELETALQSVAQLAVPSVADAAAFDLFVEGNPRRVADAASPRARAPELPVAVLEGRSTIERGPSADSIAVPIHARGELVGAFTLTVAHPRSWRAADVELPEELAHRAALSIDHARMYRHAEEALQVRDEFLTVAAHEVRMPLTSIQLAVHRLRRATPAEAAPFFELIERALRRLNRLVQELVDTGLLRGSGFRLHYEPGDLGALVRKAIHRLEPELDRSRSALELHTDGELSGRWDCDRLLLVIENLVGNALKFGAGKPIEVLARGEGERVQLVVRDHGVGIAEQARHKLFQPFGRAVSPQHYGGLGLGLYICKKIVDAFGGTIAIESTLGEGTTVRVELPRAAG